MDLMLSLERVKQSCCQSMQVRLQFGGFGPAPKLKKLIE
jgi:hypothetical protein